ncbi:hypothetical protein E0Z10_g5842 [Xylaria hypoxylon]|uniref:Uncharacterized protein n=1 Tax=Xylaria hypoxylon TaxID=37992 RepID=A0A4Z0Z2S8_9PEZI|nr:hypothetical protein E0Z10_g5842 [Xylaria hypoxylon]
MAPIPVYTNSPITAAKPDGVTPKTASSGTDASSKTSKASSSRTSTYTPSAYAAAQPGAAPSLPTTTTPASAQPYSPLQPTPTTTIVSASPAPPQPGSVPVSNLPPPPKAGERYQPPTQILTTTMPYPHQVAIPAPTAPLLQRGTSTATAPSSSPYGTQIPSAMTGTGGDGASHPAGYQQNTNASELDRYQRSAVEERELDDNENSMWGAAKKLAQQTGERLAAVESEVWKKINKE